MSELKANLPQVIGVSGEKHHGKDTAADFLVNKYGYKKLAFATPLKEACKILFGFTDEELYTDKKEETHQFWKVSPRESLQFVGTDLIRKQMGKIIPFIKEDFWIVKMKQTIYDMLQKNPDERFVISDCRFEDEIKFVTGMNGITLKIIRPSVKTTTTSNHESEKNISKIKVNYSIINDGCIEDLYMKIDNIMVQKM